MSLVPKIDFAELANQSIVPTRNEADSYGPPVFVVGDAQEPPGWLDDDGEDIGNTPMTNGNGTGVKATVPAEKPSLAEHIPLLTAAEALQPRPPQEWLVDRLFLPGSVNVLYGPPGTGKTYAFLDLGVCVALGVPWLELATKQGAVLVIDEESGQRRLLDRLAEVLRGHLADETTPIYAVSLAGFNFLDDGAWLVTLRELIQKVDARLVVIDALADVMLGGDENAVKDTQPVFHALRSVADATGAAVLVVHHSNRGGAYRGSSAIPGAVDGMIELSRRKDSTIIDIATEKQRDGEPVKMAAMMRWGDGCFDLILAPTSEPGRTFSKGEKYVLRFLLERPNGASKTDIEKKADTCSAGTARNAIYTLAEKDLAKRIDDGGPLQTATYALTQAGKEAAQAST